MKPATLIFFCFAFLSANAQTNSIVTLNDVSFIAGSGTGEMWGGTIEEHWSKPSGDTMMGMFKFIKNGVDNFYEFLVIRQTATGPVLILRHFNGGLIAWEDKEEVHTFPMTHFAPNTVTFRNEASKTALTFERKANGELHVLMDNVRNGEAKRTVFVYTSL